VLVASQFMQPMIADNISCVVFGWDHSGLGEE
jgi:hypothetical protein